MKQEIVRLSGVSYDYCEDIRFYNVLGLVTQETDTFVGVEVTSESRINLNDVKAAIQTGDFKFVCGVLGEEIVYYSMDMAKGEISHAKLKKSQEGYAGREHILCAHDPSESLDSMFKLTSNTQKVEDAELEILLAQMLKMNQTNTTLAGLQAAAIATVVPGKVKQLGA